MMSTSLLGVKFTSLTAELLHKTLTKHLSQPSEKLVTVVTPNPEILVYAQRHPEFKQLLNNANYCLPDGQGIVWLSNGRIKQRITGTDTMFALLNHANQQQLSVGIVLAENSLSSAAEVTQILNKRFPNCALTITTTAFTQPTPRIVFIAKGFPKQEWWIQQHQAELTETSIVLTVGGGIDFLTGRQQRAPLFFRQIGLEWLWRLIHQPKRLQRILNAVIIFPWYCLRYHND